MTDLSPAEEAWRAYKTADCDPYDIDPRRAGLAAALDAVARHCKAVFIQTGPGFSELDEVITCADLRAIAAELRNESTSEGD